MGQWIGTKSHCVGPRHPVARESASPSYPLYSVQNPHAALCSCFINLYCSELSAIFRRINYWIYLVLYSYLKYEPVSVVNQCARVRSRDLSSLRCAGILQFVFYMRTRSFFLRDTEDRSERKSERAGRARDGSRFIIERVGVKIVAKKSVTSNRAAATAAARIVEGRPIRRHRLPVDFMNRIVNICCYSKASSHNKNAGARSRGRQKSARPTSRVPLDRKYNFSPSLPKSDEYYFTRDARARARPRSLSLSTERPSGIMKLVINENCPRAS